MRPNDNLRIELNPNEINDIKGGQAGEVRPQASLPYYDHTVRPNYPPPPGGTAGGNLFGSVEDDLDRIHLSYGSPIPRGWGR